MVTFKKSITCTALTLLLGIPVLPAAASTANAYPERPVTLIVPFPAGGSADLVGRTLARELETQLGQSIVIENRPGASGNIGMGTLARAKPDGYTIGLGTTGTQTINQFLYKDMAFKPEKDFDPIAFVLTTPSVLSVRADSPYKNLADLIADAKKRKDKPVSYGTPGIGTTTHLTGALLEQMADIQMLHVPFKGVATSLPALIGGDIDVLFDTLPTALTHLQSQTRIRGLAITSKNPSPVVPDLPTIASQGLPGFDVTVWYGLYAPAGTPDTVMKKLISAAKKSLASDELKAKYLKMGSEPGNLFGDDLRQFEARERDTWGRLIEKRNLAVQ